MAKIVMIVPSQEMYDMGCKLAETSGDDMLVYRETLQTVLDRAKQAQNEGALVLIARGKHAAAIKQETDIPVVEILLSGQTLGQLIFEAKQLSKKKKPTIVFIVGYVNYTNMFTGVSVFEDMLGVRVLKYFYHQNSEIRDAVEKARLDGADVLICGQDVMRVADEYGISAVYLKSGIEDLSTALRTAKRVLFGIESEKKKNAEVAALLNYSFDGILQLNDTGQITMANYLAVSIFRRPQEELIGRNIADLFDEVDSHEIMRVIRCGGKKYGMMLRKGHISLVANVASVSVENVNMGGILSFQEFETIEEMEEGIRLSRATSSFRAKAHFSQIKTVSPEYKEVLRQAENLAPFDIPVLLHGPIGTGKQQLAECIHNASLRRKNPFVTFDCANMPPEIQMDHFIAGDNRGALQKAHTGTLFIRHIDQMDAYCQYQLNTSLAEGIVWLKNQALPVNIRVVASTSADIFQYVSEGRFSLPLYSRLSQGELYIPSLSMRREDIPELVRDAVTKYSVKYKKHIQITESAMTMLSGFEWPGNGLQLELMIEKLVLLAEDRVVDMEQVQRYLPRSFLQNSKNNEPTQGDGSEAERILLLLETHHGDRKKVAEELGISVTTLWRRIRKYGIEKSFRI